MVSATTNAGSGTSGASLPTRSRLMANKYTALDPLFGDIAAAIRFKDGTAALIPAEDFPERIRNIPTAPSPSEPLDPVEVYNATRPADWLTMPEPQDNEMYLLFHIPDGVSSLLAFTVTCTGNYTVALGTVTNGQFVQQSAVSVASGAKYEAELFADDFGSLTSTGTKQVMIKISGTDILTWNPSTHSKKTAPKNFYSWHIVEIVCRLPSGNKVTAQGLRRIRYFTWIGTSNVTTMSSMFDGCKSLTAIPQLDTSKVTNMNSMFIDCSSLVAIPQLDTSNVTTMSSMFRNCINFTIIPQLDTSKVTNMSSMFNGHMSLTAMPQLDTSNVTDMGGMFCSCNSLAAIPQLDTSKVTNMNMMFYGCVSLTAIPQLDTSNVTDMGGMFGSCNSLAAIPQLDTSKVTNMNMMFYAHMSLTAIPQLDTSNVTDMGYLVAGCSSLAVITLDPAVSNWAGCDISLKDCSLGHKALVDLFNSLPTITTSKALTITGNPGVSELTDVEKAIATNKNWTLTL